MTSRSEYLRALSEAPGRPLSDDCTIPGLGAGEFALAALWAVQARTAEMLVDGVEESLHEGREFVAGTWND